MSFSPPGDCPCCGAFVQRRARNCRACGASDTDGWTDAAHSLPDEEPLSDFDYDAYVEREFHRAPSGGSRGTWAVLALVVLLLLGLVLSPLFR